MHYHLVSAVCLLGLVVAGGCSSGPDAAELGGDELGVNAYTQAQTNRSVVAPAMGIEEPTKTQKFAEAVNPINAGKKVGASIKSGAASLTAFVMPKDKSKAELDPLSLANESKPTPQLHVAIAQQMERQGNIKGAKTNYEQALKMDSKCREAMLGYARLLDRNEELVAATKQYQQALKLYPDDATCHNDLGICYARQGRFEEAAVALRRAVEIDPKYSQYRNNLAVVLFELGRVDEAYTEVAAVHGEAVAHYNIGYLLSTRGQTAAAQKQFALALQKNPELTQARQWLDRLNGSSIAATQGRQPPAQQAMAPQVNGRGPMNPAAPATELAQRPTQYGATQAPPAPRYTNATPVSQQRYATPPQTSAPANAVPQATTSDWGTTSQQSNQGAPLAPGPESIYRRTNTPAAVAPYAPAMDSGLPSSGPYGSTGRY